MNICDFIITDVKYPQLINEYKSWDFSIQKILENAYIVKFAKCNNRLFVGNLSLEEWRKLGYITNYTLEISKNNTIYFYFNTQYFNIVNIEPFKKSYQNDFISKYEYKDVLGYNYQFEIKNSLSKNDILYLFNKTELEIKFLYENLIANEYNTVIPFQINHILEFEMNANLSIRTCLAENGKELLTNLHDADVWAEKLNYANIPVNIGLDLFFQLRRYYRELIKEESLDNFYFSNGNKVYLRDILFNLGKHTKEHIDQLKELMEGKNFVR